MTQNVDGLHQRAGSINVNEIHGHLRVAVCVDCLQRHDSESFFETFVATGIAPNCALCGGHLKPEVVLFGAQLPHEPIASANAMFDSSDMVIIGGSSLEVAPASELPFRALERSASLVISNQNPTYLDSRADVVLTGDVAELLPVIVGEVHLEQ